MLQLYPLAEAALRKAEARRPATAPQPVEAPWPAALAEEAYHGPAGALVRAIGPRTEADPAAILLQVLCCFGSVVGRGPHFRAEADYHFSNLFVLLVGETAKGRKGTSWGHARAIFETVDEAWAKSCIASGLSSGEGLIWSVRDAITSREPVKERGRVVDYQEVETDPGVSDKRRLVVETEFASTLRVLGREGNTLSAVIRNCWDSGDLRILTRNSPAVATGAHVSILGHVTKDELRRELSTTEAGNGFANRFLFVCVRRSKSLPEGGALHTVDLGRLVRELTEAAAFARGVGELRRDEEARSVWHRVYDALSDGKPGLFGAVTARAEAQVMRLASLYALLDRSATVRREHLLAGLAVWQYCEDGARHIFGDAVGDTLADTLLTALRQAPDGLTRDAIWRDVFGKHRRAEDIERALHGLETRGQARMEREETAGRPRERWIATPYDAYDAYDAGGPAE